MTPRPRDFYFGNAILAVIIALIALILILFGAWNPAAEDEQYREKHPHSHRPFVQPR
jgi:hypothetical protein